MGRNIWTNFVVLAAVFSIQGCAGPGPNIDAMRTADYGESITESAAQRIAQGWLEANLKDPDTARFQRGAFGKAWALENVAAYPRIYYGYGLAVAVNAKNGFGGYSGWQSFFFFFRDGKFILQYGGQPGSDGRWGFLPPGLEPE